MTPKERILSAIQGKPVDRVPWCPFLAYWWEKQPESFREQGQLAFMEAIGADPLLRGIPGVAWRVEFKGTNFRNETRGEEMENIYETPVGTLRERYIHSPEGDTWFLVGHAVKIEEDYKILQWMYEHAVVHNEPEVLNQNLREIGNRGLGISVVGPTHKSAFQSLVEQYVGTQELSFALFDFPETVEACLEAMRQVSYKTAEISVESDAEVFIFFEDSSTTNISPAMFEKYTMPEIDTWGRIIHGADKLLLHHACGHVKGLLPHMSQLPLDGIESMSPPPTGNISYAEARPQLPGNIALIGGIEPTIFEKCTMEELEQNVYQLLHDMKGTRFVLANSDSCPPGVSMEKWKAIAGWVKKYS